MTALLDRDHFITASCKGKRIVHVGCCDSPYTADKLRLGTLLHTKLAQVAQSCIGLDIDPESLRLMRQAGFSDLVECDIETFEFSPNTNIDVVVMGEVLEHVNNVGLALSRIGATYPNAQLLVTVPNAFYLHRALKYFLFGVEEVHPDHVYYFSEKTLRETLRRAGYAVTCVAYSIAPPQSTLGWISKWALKPFYWLNPRIGQSVMASAVRN